MGIIAVPSSSTFQDPYHGPGKAMGLSFYRKLDAKTN
jgi:uracil DNA glycosylase